MVINKNQDDPQGVNSGLIMHHHISLGLKGQSSPFQGKPSVRVLPAIKAAKRPEQAASNGIQGNGQQIMYEEVIYCMETQDIVKTAFNRERCGLMLTLMIVLSI